MTPYALQRIREALTANKGNRKKTEDMVRAIALDDPKLFADLMLPHLAGVVAHSVGRIVEGKEESNDMPQAKPVPVAFPQDAFGRDLVQAIKKNDIHAFGMPQPKTLASGPKPASKQHIDTMKAIASKNITKDKK